MSSTSLFAAVVNDGIRALAGMAFGLPKPAKGELKILVVRGDWGLLVICCRVGVGVPVIFLCLVTFVPCGTGNNDERATPLAFANELAVGARRVEVGRRGVGLHSMG